MLLLLLPRTIAELISNSDLFWHRRSQFRTVLSSNVPKVRRRAKTSIIGGSGVAYFNEDGICIIGMEANSIMPLIIFDTVSNVSTD